MFHKSKQNEPGTFSPSSSLSSLSTIFQLYCHFNFFEPVPRAATFTCVNGTVPFYVFAINVYKIGLPFTRTLPCDQCRGLLIAFSNEHSALDHQSVCLFSQISLYLIKYLLQLELRRHAQLTVSYDREHFFKFFVYRACANTQWLNCHKNVLNIV